MTEPTKETYNGHANYETWLIALWFGNTEDYYYSILGALKDYRAEGTTADDLPGKLADFMHDLIDSIVDEDKDEVSGISADYLGHLVGMVDYFELARDFIDDHPED